LAVEQANYRLAALDWFAEQAEDPDLMRARGLRPGQPVPPEFGLFDDTGRVLPRWRRDSVRRLRAWLDDEQAMLEWVFPEGLADEERAHLLAEMAQLRRQPWSLHAALDATLADWPEDQPEVGMTQADIEAPLMQVCESLLAELEKQA
jgi:hypothetical protein